VICFLWIYLKTTGERLSSISTPVENAIYSDLLIVPIEGVTSAVKYLGKIKDGNIKFSSVVSAAESAV
jgi:hypothetical protein